jgi:hypothetical protein
MVHSFLERPYLSPNSKPLRVWSSFAAYATIPSAILMNHRDLEPGLIEVFDHLTPRTGGLFPGPGEPTL